MCGHSPGVPADDTVIVARVTDDAGQMLASIVNYACHPTTLSFTKWCGDYPGFAQVEIEQQHPGTLALGARPSRALVVASRHDELSCDSRTGKSSAREDPPACPLRAELLPR